MTQTRYSRRFVILCLIILFVVTRFSSLAYGQSDEQKVSVKVEEVERGFEEVYPVIIEAEKFDADTSVLIQKLNEALDLYNEAKMALKNEDYDEAVRLADETQLLLEKLHGGASDLRNYAEIRSERIFRNQLILSSSIIGVIIASGYVGWGKFKEHYISGTMKLRPEVVIDES